MRTAALATDAAATNGSTPSSGVARRRRLQVVPQPAEAAQDAGRTTAVEVGGRTSPRIAGAGTERMPVRACAGDDLGRGVTARVGHRPPASRRVRHEPVAEIEPPALRLTRRGRAVLTVLSVLVFGSAIAVLGLRVAGVLDPEPQFTRTVQVEVGAGQTLWQIAQDTNPTENPAVVVERIADLNNLHDPSDVTPGRTLQVPVR